MEKGRMQTDRVGLLGYDCKPNGNFLSVFLIVHTVLANPKYIFIHEHISAIRCGGLYQ